MKRLVSITFLFIILLNFAPAWLGIEQTGAANYQSELRRLHNAERAKRNLPPFRSDASLVRSAKSYAKYMLANNHFSHVGLDNSTPDDRIRAAGYAGNATGENIALGYTTAEEVFDGWMKSPGHRRNIRSRLFNRIGFGQAGDYWVTTFGG